MADRTSAGLFGTFFEFLAEEPDERSKVMAEKLWRISKRYDFGPCQMDCDDALVKLGLARLDADGVPEYAEAAG